MKWLLPSKGLLSMTMVFILQCASKSALRRGLRIGISHTVPGGVDVLLGSTL